MNNVDNFNPDWVSKPGNTIKDILENRGINYSKFAMQLGKDVFYVENLISAIIEIDEQLAEKLSNVLGSTKQFWLNRECNYREGLKAGKKDI